jgi:hypothetical protein
VVAILQLHRSSTGEGADRRRGTCLLLVQLKRRAADGDRGRLAVDHPQPTGVESPCPMQLVDGRPSRHLPHRGHGPSRRLLRARLRRRYHAGHDRGGSSPFQIIEGPAPPAPAPMFRRGRTDHFALLAPTEEAFRELRRRIEAEGAADGDVRDMRSHWIMGYFDPDGAAHEVMLERRRHRDSDMLERAGLADRDARLTARAHEAQPCRLPSRSPEFDGGRGSRDVQRGQQCRFSTQPVAREMLALHGSRSDERVDPAPVGCCDSFGGAIGVAAGRPLRSPQTEGPRWASERSMS